MNSIRMFRSARGLDDIDAAEGEDPLFTTNTGRAYSPSYLSQYITKAIKESGLPFFEVFVPLPLVLIPSGMLLPSFLT
ncbi:hypothetical protein RCO48_08680 [Peribacillus frigoritolerans]|nr:hypothetical protein [Peribacillus frigoritolerans]